MNVLRNFSAGPGALPATVLAEAQRAVAGLPGTGVSILGLSHRSRAFRDVLDEAEERVRRLLEVPEGYRVLFLQGGGTLQFSMVPMAMLPAGSVADYIVGGYWSGKAYEAARHHGRVRVAWDGAPDNFRRLPPSADALGAQDASYLHFVSNETVEGLQFRAPPSARCPVVCDASSDLLSRPMDIKGLSLVYAHAQKNIGPAGVTLVLVRDEVLADRPLGLPPVLDYRAHAEARSLLHTPPVFSIYVVLLSLRWLADEVGGLAPMGRINADKARVVRQALGDCEAFYRHDVDPGFESDMNVTFRCGTPQLDARFVSRAEQAGLLGTEGHRSRGGLRISLYNGVTLDDAMAMAAFLSEFAHEHRNDPGASRASPGRGTRVTRAPPSTLPPAAR